MSVRDKLISTENSLNEFYFERSDTIRAISVGLMSNLNVILVGPPGTAKTDVSKAYTSHIKGANYFGTTLNPFTIPDEVFGAVDIKNYKESGLITRRTDGYLPSAHIVAIEEIFKAGKGMLNSLIEVSHPSRLFSNGPKQEKTPVLTMIGTSNELPIGEKELSAIYDRMIIKIYVKPLNEPDNFSKMIMAQNKYEPETFITLKEVEKAREEVRNVALDEGILKRLVVLRENLAKKGVHPSDRTFKLCVGALQANAYMDGRDAITDEDILFLRHMLWYEPNDEPQVWRVIINLVKPELKKLGEIFQAVQSSATEAIEKENHSEMVVIHKKIQDYLKEAKKIRADMVKKGRGTSECDEIIRKLKGYAGKLSRMLIGIDENEDSNNEAYY